MDNPGGGGLGVERPGEISPEVSQILPESLPPLEQPGHQEPAKSEKSLISQDVDSPGPLPADSETTPLTGTPPVEESSPSAVIDLTGEDPASLERAVDDQISRNIEGIQ